MVTKESICEDCKCNEYITNHEEYALTLEKRMIQHFKIAAPHGVKPANKGTDPGRTDTEYSAAYVIYIAFAMDTDRLAIDNSARALYDTTSLSPDDALEKDNGHKTTKSDEIKPILITVSPRESDMYQDDASHESIQATISLPVRQQNRAANTHTESGGEPLLRDACSAHSNSTELNSKGNIQLLHAMVTQTEKSNPFSRHHDGVSCEDYEKAENNSSFQLETVHNSACGLNKELEWRKESRRSLKDHDDKILEIVKGNSNFTSTQEGAQLHSLPAYPQHSLDRNNSTIDSDNCSKIGGANVLQDPSSMNGQPNLQAFVAGNLTVSPYAYSEDLEYNPRAISPISSSVQSSTYSGDDQSNLQAFTADNLTVFPYIYIDDLVNENSLTSTTASSSVQSLTSSSGKSNLQAFTADTNLTVFPYVYIEDF